MDFEFSEEQLAARDVARSLLEREWPVERLRAAWQGEHQPGVLLGKLAEVGFLGMLIPAEHGGMDGDLVDLVLLLEEVGRAGVAEPYVEAAVVAPALLTRAGTDEQRQRWLPAIAAGQALTATQLDGSPFVLDADRADLLLTVVDGELHAVPGDQVQSEPVTSNDRARRLFRVSVQTSADTRMDGAADDARWAAHVGAAGSAAVLNGISTRLLEMSLTHAKDREQFGRPIGAFQAVKHKLASMLLLVESSQATTAYAAYALARGLPDAPRAAAVAKAYANDAAAFCNTESLQVHGGIGFTWEHDLHLWLKRGAALEQTWGTTRQLRRYLADEVLAGARAD